MRPTGEGKGNTIIDRSNNRSIWRRMMKSFLLILLMMFTFLILPFTVVAHDETISPNNGVFIDARMNGDGNWYTQYNWGPDIDGDGYRPILNYWTCTKALPGNFSPVPEGVDCDDAEDTAYPGNPEICDGLDNDCDDLIDEDLDGVTEICDLIDNNCDGQVDEGCNQSAWYEDTDSDLYGNPSVMQMAENQPTGYVDNNLDCDDTDDLINPLATDDNCDAIDNNCDSQADEGWVDYATNCGAGVCSTTGMMYCNLGAPTDSCAPLTATEDPEITCNDGLDNDCDGDIDIVDADCNVSACDIDSSGTYFQAEDFTSIGSNGSGKFLFDTAISGFFGSGYLQSEVGSWPDGCGDIIISESFNYSVNFPTTGVYNVWVRGYAIDSSANTVFFGLDNQCTGSLYTGSFNQWAWADYPYRGVNTITVSTPGTYTINIWVSEVDHIIDGIYLTTGSETPTDAVHGVEIVPCQ